MLTFSLIIALLTITIQERSTIDERFIEDTVPAELEKRRDVADLILRLSVLRRNQSIFGEKHPQFQRIRVDIRALEDQLSALLNAGKPTPLATGAKKSDIAPLKKTPLSTETVFVGGSSRSNSTSSRAVLQASDFEYLGFARLPADMPGVRFGYSYGTSITTRRVGDKLHLFMCMSHAGESVVGKVCELVYQGVGQRMTVFKVWGDIFGSKRNVMDVNGIHQFGLNWDGEKLLWSFGPNYSGEHSRTIGATTFDGTLSFTSYGSWRTQCHAKQSNGFMINIPSDKQSLFGGHTHMIGGISTSINALNTWGHSLNSFNSTRLLDSSEDSINDTSDVSIPTTEIMTANLSNKMRRDPTWQKCTKTLTGGGYTCDSPTLEDPVGVVSDIDMGNGAVWIQNTKKHGIVFLSVMVDRINDAAFRAAHYDGGDLPHSWYATEGSPCCHHHTAYIPGTGPHTSSLVPQFWIYDPDDLSDRGLSPIQRANKPVSKHLHLWELNNALPKVLDYYYYTGCAYDPVERLLFVAISHQDTVSQFEPIPLVYVFRVAE